MLVDFSAAMLVRFSNTALSDKLSLLCKWVLQAQEGALHFVSKTFSVTQKLQTVLHTFYLQVKWCDVFIGQLLFNIFVQYGPFEMSCLQQAEHVLTEDLDQDVKVISGLSGQSSSYFRPLLIKLKPDLCAKDSETTAHCLSSISLVHLVNESGVSCFPDGYIGHIHLGW